MIQLKYI